MTLRWRKSEKRGDGWFIPKINRKSEKEEGETFLPGLNRLIKNTRHQVLVFLYLFHPLFSPFLSTSLTCFFILWNFFSTLLSVSSTCMTYPLFWLSQNSIKLITVSKIEGYRKPLRSYLKLNKTPCKTTYQHKPNTGNYEYGVIPTWYTRWVYSHTVSNPLSVRPLYVIVTEKRGEVLVVTGNVYVTVRHDPTVVCLRQVLLFWYPFRRH